MENSITEQLAGFRALLRMPELEVGDKFCSPFRNDGHPGAYLFLGEFSDKIRMYDHADERVNGKSVLELLYMVHKLNKAQGQAYLSRSHQKAPVGVVHRSIKRLEYVEGQWATHHLEYWNRYKVPPSVYLQCVKITNLLKVHLVSGDKRVTTEIDYPKGAFVYPYKEGRFKLYNPVDKTRPKWYGSQTQDDHVVRKCEGDDLWVTKSEKDSVCMWAHHNVNVTSFLSESVLPSDLEWMKPYRTIKILYDNDKPGHEGAFKLAAHLKKQLDANVEAYTVPIEIAKDYSDAVLELNAPFDLLNLKKLEQ